MKVERNLKGRPMKDQQLQWLTEIYPELGRIAQAIIQDSVTGAEDAVSNAVTEVLIKIKDGRCRAVTKAAFALYCRKHVRTYSIHYFTRYIGDVLEDHGKSNAIAKMRPNTRRTPAVKPEQDIDDFNPYERWETTGDDENSD
jgi:hypothetical protein